jgi:alkylglycerol monooxygenase
VEMEAYGKLLLIAMPAFLVLVIFEKWWGWYRGNDTVRLNDMISSLSSGITNVIKDILGLTIVIISYPWMKDHFMLMSVPDGWPTFVVAFIALDFAGYWVHRISHTVNLFWNNHIIHHSSEEFNLACALRQSISSIIKIFAVFLLPAALLGVPQKVIAVIAPLHLFAQFWYHTRHISKLGFLEHLIVTPSHHRVHHAINPEYLDKNFGQIFIWWDKLFGTFQKELDDVPCVYGVTRPVRTWNPVRINFMHLIFLIRDAWYTARWSDKLTIWFRPLGWRPEDVAKKFPVYKVSEVYTLEKYDRGDHKQLLIWTSAQMFFVLMAVAWLCGNVASIGAPDLFYYGMYIILVVFSYTEMLDMRSEAVWWEAVKMLVGVALSVYSGGWFGLEAWIPGLSFLIPGFLILSFLTALILSRRLQGNPLQVS